MDKLNMLINCKIPLRFYLQVKDMAAEEGVPISIFMRRALVEKVHASKLRMQDYLGSDEESQD